MLPRLLAAIGFRRGLLLGHSDGASIAAIYAGSIQDHRVRGLVLIAPHFFVEDVSIESIAEAKTAYGNGDLRAKLARWHKIPTTRSAAGTMPGSIQDFREWDITEELAYIRVPILIVQGEDDQYGTVKQIEVAQEECYCPVEVALLAGAKHSPHREAPDATLKAVSDFANRLLRDHAEGRNRRECCITCRQANGGRTRCVRHLTASCHSRLHDRLVFLRAVLHARPGTCGHRIGHARFVLSAFCLLAGGHGLERAIGRRPGRPCHRSDNICPA